MDIVSLAPILLLVVAFYFLLIRPQRNRAKAQQSMMMRWPFVAENL